MPQIFSVVIPAYNQAEYLEDAIESVLSQTYPNLELIVVNDASPDDTLGVMEKFKDARIRVVTHQTNRGLSSARNTGMSAASGDFIALLDADDYFHPEKLEEHLRFYQQHPEISITYNARYELHHSSENIRDLYNPVPSVELKDFVLGFPFSPSDMIFRRAVDGTIFYFDEDLRCGGEDLDFPCRLALEGKQFARVNGVLNYRRFHAGRKKKNLRCRFDDYTRALDRVFQDPRCPPNVLSIRTQAYVNHYTEVACLALAQGEVELGNEIIQKILQLDPSFSVSHPSKLVDTLFYYFLRDETLDHAEMLPAVCQQLPMSLRSLPGEVERLVAEGYLLKGARSALWGDVASAGLHFDHASRLVVEFDEEFCMRMAAQLLVYEQYLGLEQASQMANRLFRHLGDYGGNACARKVMGHLSANRAFLSYRKGEYFETLRNATRTILRNPRYIVNRGVLSIIARSLWGIAHHNSDFPNLH